MSPSITVHAALLAPYRHGLKSHCSENYPFIPGRMGPKNPKSIRPETLECDDIDTVAPISSQPANILEGELWIVPHMPVDILFEIFSHLDPKDLLNLSRTTHFLREIVISRQSRHIWRTSLANVRALPPCPADLTEIEYASLAFDDYCHFCPAVDVREIFWICRVRACVKCIPKYFRSEGELEVWIPEVIIEKPDSMFPYITQRMDKNGGKSPLYYFAAAKEYLRELDDILLTNDDDALAEWIQKKKDAQTLRVSHAQLCKNWTYRHPQPPNRYEEIIVLVLLLILSFLWRDRIKSMILL